MTPYEKIARILRADKDTIRLLEENLAAKTGKEDVMAKIVSDNEETIKNRLELLGLSKKTPLSANDIYESLIHKVEADDAKLAHSVGGYSCDSHEGCKNVCEAINKVSKSPKGFFLKKDKAVELLRKEPPRKIIEFLGYRNVDDLLKGEDLLQIYSALRFFEGSDWLNEVFFKQYENLKPEDFEEREIVVMALDEKWRDAANVFVKKKFHNISHLKEIGVIFIIPACLGVAGELFRSFSLILHYLNEIVFYSDILKALSENPKEFAPGLVSLLRGDVIDERLPQAKNFRWYVVQRYLAKNDENDWRLFEPHVNPEAIHWSKAEKMLFDYGELSGFGKEMSFWQNLNWVGDYFLSDTGIEVLVSFNIVDTAMSLVREKELIKYLYHHQESLWNKIFIEYFGREEMEKLIKKNLLKGYFEI